MQIQEFYDTYWNRIENRLKRIIRAEELNAPVRDIVLYHLKNPGKRLRPFLFAGLDLSFGRDVSDDDLDVAASVELLHNASIVHDDIEDQDFSRRGVVNVWRKYSASQAINTGDFLFAKAVEIVLLSGLKSDLKVLLMQRTAVAINELIHGQMLEISFLNSVNMTREDWELIAAQKTGALLRLIFEQVFLLAGVDITKHQKDLDDLGRLIGILYQLRDDLLDALGLKEGRPQGSDIAEGKMTCLSIVALEKSHENMPLIRKLLVDGDDGNIEPRIRQMIEIYERYGIVDEIRDRFDDCMEQCRTHPLIDSFPHIRPVMESFLGFLVVPR